MEKINSIVDICALGQEKIEEDRKYFKPMERLYKSQDLTGKALRKYQDVQLVATRKSDIENVSIDNIMEDTRVWKQNDQENFFSKEAKLEMQIESHNDMLRLYKGSQQRNVWKP